MGQIDRHAFLWHRGHLSCFTSLGTQYAEAYGINNCGQVVGHAYDLGGENQPECIHEHALIWQQRKVYDLNKCLPAKSGWALQVAKGINDRGQIVGTGIHNGHTRAFLLTPITK